MTEQENEALSALADGELPAADRDRLLDLLAGSPELAATWSRYQLIGTAIRRGVPEAHDPGLPEKVHAAIGDTLPDGDAGEVVPELGKTDDGRDWRRSAGGVAMAASVAALALFGISWFTPTAEGPDLVAGQTSQPVATAALVRPVAERAPEATGEALDQERLTRYLMRHNEYASAGGMRGLPPNVRVVSQEGTTRAR
jgi:sigma-E factor negative regulatory protein RseA